MIEQVDEQVFGDLFGQPALKSTIPSFGMNQGENDIFIPVKTEPVVVVDDNVYDTVVVDDKDDTVAADILNDDKVIPKYDFSDTSGYFEDRFKNGKFVPIEQVGEDGKPINFVPKTPEEFDEVIDLQVNYQLQQRTKELEKNWYTSKSPAWQAVAKFAEMTDDPTEIVPFLQGIRTMESVGELDPTDLTGAEKIVRARLEQRGDDEDVIAETIDSLKTTDKLVSAAQKYKPLIMQQEKQQLTQMLAEKNQQDQDYRQMVVTIRENAIKAIEAPIFGKQNLKQEEKAAIYDMIAEPQPETKGYRIYTAIDELFEKGDFGKLKKIALILSNEDALLDYISTGAATKTAEKLQKQLRVSTEGRASSTSSDSGDERRIQRNQYSNTPRFGK